MFHHFHNDVHQPSQGSLSAAGFRDMLNWLSQRYSILGANEYLQKFESGTICKSDICLSFDDALKSQYDVAIPILEEFNLDGFFFVYSSVFTDKPDFLEIYRFFRTTEFEHVDDFYSEFFRLVEESDRNKYRLAVKNFLNLDYLSEYNFYTENDKWFRYLRDQFLTLNKYHSIMNNMITKKNFKVDEVKKKLWMTEDNLKTIHKKGHVVGLHSYSHPTQMSRLSKEEQFNEYKKNFEHLSRIIGNRIETMSHPCGDYDNDTLQILKEMGIKMGFR